MALLLAPLALGWRAPLLVAPQRAARGPPEWPARALVRACADDLDSQIAKEREAVEALRRSVSELEEKVQAKRDALQAAPPGVELASERVRETAEGSSATELLSDVSGGTLATEVFEDFIAEVEKGGVLRVSDELRAVLFQAWEEGFALQQKEIAGLKKSITAISDLEGKLDGNMEGTDLIDELVKTTEIVDAETEVDVSMLSLVQGIYTFYRNLDRGELSGAMDRLVEDDDSPSSVYSAQLKLLRDHQVAGCVEHRRFAEKLSAIANGTLDTAAGGLSAPQDPLTTVMVQLLYPQFNKPFQDDAEAAEAKKLLADLPMLQRYTEVAAPALEGGEFTAIGGMLFVVSLSCIEQKSVECAAVYVFARAMAAANLKRLAFCAGTSPPTDIEAAVVQQERALGGADFASNVFSTAAFGFLSVAFYLFLGWQLFSFISSALFGSQ